MHDDLHYKNGTQSFNNWQCKSKPTILVLVKVATTFSFDVIRLQCPVESCCRSLSCHIVT